MSKLELFLLVVYVANVAIVLEFIRRRRLLEGFALLWLSVGVGLVVLALARPLVDRLANALGITGPSIVLSFGIFFLLFVAMGLSLHVSKLEEGVEVLAVEVTFLRGVRAHGVNGRPCARSPSPASFVLVCTSSPEGDRMGVPKVPSVSFRILSSQRW